MTETMAVIIPNWNGARWLVTCLESLRQQTYRDFKTYVVDNGSTDGSTALLDREYPEVRVIALPDNIGFAGAVNAGIRASVGRYVVALNNDTEAHPNWLGELVAAVEKRPDVGSAASCLLDFKDRDRIDSLGDGLFLHGRAYKLGNRQVMPAELVEPFEILCPCAAAALYRRDMLDQIGLFDESFFAYLEDIDLGLRAQRAGFKCLSVPRARIFHVGSASSGGGGTPFTVGLTARNVYFTMIKNFPLALLPLCLAATLATQLGALLASLFLPRLGWLRAAAPAVFHGIAEAAASAPSLLRTHRLNSRTPTIGMTDFLHLLWTHWRCARRFGKPRSEVSRRWGSNLA